MESNVRIVQVEGASVELPRLTLDDVCTIAEKVCSEWEKKARKLGIEEKLDRNQLNQLILSVRTRMPSLDEIHTLALSPAGARIIIQHSIEKGKAADKITMKDLSAVDAIDIAVDLLVGKPEKKEDKVEQDPLAGSDPVI
jgi:hypothetical protein